LRWQELCAYEKEHNLPRRRKSNCRNKACASTVLLSSRTSRNDAMGRLIDVVAF